MCVCDMIDASYSMYPPHIYITNPDVPPDTSPRLFPSSREFCLSKRVFENRMPFTDHRGSRGNGRTFLKHSI